MSTVDEQPQTSGAVYERPDTDAGFVTDATEIMQLKAIRKSDIINSQLLGEFDEFGVYEIEKPVVVELVRLPKRITHQNEFGTFAEVAVEDKILHFRMLPTKQVGDKLVSQLELLEEVYHANGYIINTRTTLLATYALEPVSDFEQIAREVFHISANPDDDFGDDGDGNAVLAPKEAEYIKHRLAYLKAMGLVSSGLYEKLEEAYFNKRIKILNSVPEGAVVLAEYKKQYEKIEHFFVNNSKNKYRAMNDLLTSIIEGPKGDKIRKNPEYRAQMKEANRIYLKTIHQIDESVKKSMEVIDAVSKTMPIHEEIDEIKTKNLVVATTKAEQKKNETNAIDKKQRQEKRTSSSRSSSKNKTKSGGSGEKNKARGNVKEKKKIASVGRAASVSEALAKFPQQNEPRVEKRPELPPTMANISGERNQMEGGGVAKKIFEENLTEMATNPPSITETPTITPEIIHSINGEDETKEENEIISGLR